MPVPRVVALAWIAVAASTSPGGGGVGGAREAPGPLKGVPADALAFVIVRNAGEVAAKVDAFAKRVSPPGEPLLPLPLLEMVKQQTAMGEGLNARGAFVAVMLDPEDYGLDLGKVVGDPEAKLTSDQVPLVALIPGRDAGRLFAARKPVVEDGVVRFRGQDDRPRYCLQAGEHIALGANLKAVRAVAGGAAKSVAGRLGAAWAASGVGADVAVWVDARKLGGILTQLLRRSGPPGTARSQVGGPLGAGRDVLAEELDSILVTLRFGDDALAVDVRATFRAGSELGRCFQEYKVPSIQYFRRLPAGAYVASGQWLAQPKAPQAWLTRRLAAELASGPAAKLPAASKARYRKARLELDRRIQAVQLQLSFTAGADGKLRAVCVLACDSAEKVRQLVGELVGLAEEAAKAAGPGPRRARVRFQAGAATVGQRKADAIIVDLPEADAKVIRALHGSAPLRVLLAEADGSTLVMTFGGGERFLAEALRTAAGRAGKLAGSPGVAKAMAMLPPGALGVGLLNARNLQALIKAARTAAGGQAVAVTIDTDVPFAGALHVAGGDLQLSVRLPIETVREVMKVVSALLEEDEEDDEEPDE